MPLADILEDIERDANGSKFGYGIDEQEAAEDISSGADSQERPEPLPLPSGLLPVAPFDFDLLPDALRTWAADICERMQCPPDYVAVALMVALSAVIGRKASVRPQENTDWTVTANLWGALIGRPGVMKSPAMDAAMGPIKRLAAIALEKYQTELREYTTIKTVEKLRHEAAEKAARAILQKDPKADVSHILSIEVTEEPALKRYIAVDSTAAALGELHRQNPNGIMVYRDELVSLLKSLDQEENAEARGFYLTGWNGDSPYTFDRITRGMNLHIPAVCLSLLGSTQPARIASYVKGAITGGSGDDGLLQRFGLVVWPDVSGTWKDVDRYPDSEAKRQAFKVFDALNTLEPTKLGGQMDVGFDGVPEGKPYFRFNTVALGLFREWRQDLETLLRSEDLHPALESHFAKYRKLVPGLALILHLADGNAGNIGEREVLKALAWSEYLGTHARRLYASVTSPEVTAAKAIVSKITSGALNAVFTVWEVWRPGWSGLTDRKLVHDALDLLADYGWIVPDKKATGGRQKIEYHANPKIMRGDA